MSLRFAYNTNGTAHHRLDDAIDLIAEAGYQGVALTLDIHHLDPFAESWLAEAQRVSSRLQRLGLGSVIETGARFLLDPRAKHEPTLVSGDAVGRARRIGFLKRAIDIGAILHSEAVSFWAGVPKDGIDREEARGWLREGLTEVVAHAAERNVVACLEPEPGMLIETLDDYAALDIPGLRLALDTGHCLVTGERDPAVAVAEFADRIGTVAIEDMARGIHIHLPFGEGDMDVPGVLNALDAIHFDKLICVELSRESHRADLMVPASLKYLRDCRNPNPGAAA
jgi:D-psicose/D-tagatose/L-ribulose 3-epimerase